jgi:hypothetical protein
MPFNRCCPFPTERGLTRYVGNGELGRSNTGENSVGNLIVVVHSVDAYAGQATVHINRDLMASYASFLDSSKDIATKATPRRPFGLNGYSSWSPATVTRHSFAAGPPPSEFATDLEDN